MQGRCSSAASARTRRRAKARLSTRWSIPETCTSSTPRQASASTAPMRTGHDNERVSNERLNASRLRGQVEDLALTRDDAGLLVLRFHCRRPGRVHRSDPPGFPAALEQISLDRENKALVITGTGTRSWTRSTGRASARSSSRPPGRSQSPEGAKVLQRLLELPIPVVGGKPARDPCTPSICSLRTCY